MSCWAMFDGSCTMCNFGGASRVLEPHLQHLACTDEKGGQQHLVLLDIHILQSTVRPQLTAAGSSLKPTVIGYSCSYSGMQNRKLGPLAATHRIHIPVMFAFSPQRTLPLTHMSFTRCAWFAWLCSQNRTGWGHQCPPGL
jgi:hypothetical protein